MHFEYLGFTVKARKLEDGLPRLAHGARHLPTLSLAVYASFLPSFMSSNFGSQNVFLQVLPHSETCPTFWLQVLARFRNSRGHRGRAFTQAPAVPGPTVTALLQVLAGFSTRRNRFPPSTGSSENAIIAMPAMRFPSTGRSQTVDGTAESRSPKYGHIQNPPYCIQNHAENALPQVLTGFRNNQRHGGIAFPQTTPTMLWPKYWRDSESINGMGESLSPKYWRFLDPPEKCFPLVLVHNYERSRRTTDPGARGCGVAVSGMLACGGRCEEIWCLPRGVNLEDRTQRLAPFGNHAGCRTAQNGKLEDWVSGPSVRKRTFQLSGFDHMW